ncbi:MAG: patatin-like phospholipase family protein [Dehalococcoides mccartyi]|uniref:Patatin-like phospholipase family protein n=1 Tax=Dehalococcoides mccartyi TaxID=61435 RepID=A0AB38Z854_9CHLR|nr:patatin-like phospholipase family protein [Dehalococcoides mccartyi]WRO06682.1 patatin-like phospholipase family protein [Dehalococcoides mccartyi]
MSRDLLSRKKVGLALGSGAAKGLAHIGILSALREQDIPIDMIAGTSMGSLVGALYAEGKDIDQIKDLATDLGPKRFSYFADPALPKSGLIRGQKIRGMLRSIIGDIEFSDLEIPFACSATDIACNQEVVIKEGLVWEGVMASCSIPVLLTPAKWGSRYLVDGGLVDPVPVRILKEMGADFVIAVNVVPVGRENLNGARLENTELKAPNMFNIAISMVNSIACLRLKSSLVGANVIIEPKVTHIGWGDFHRAPECVLQGELAVRDSIQEIKRQLAG